MAEDKKKVVKKTVKKKSTYDGIPFKEIERIYREALAKDRQFIFIGYTNKTLKIAINEFDLDKLRKNIESERPKKIERFFYASYIKYIGLGGNHGF